MYPHHFSGRFLYAAVRSSTVSPYNSRSEHQSSALSRHHKAHHRHARNTADTKTTSRS